jgi:hypothetical protein
MALLIAVLMVVGVTIWGLLPQHPKCSICGIRADRQRRQYWLCDSCADFVGWEARKRQGIAWSMEHGYIETNKDTRDVEIEIIEELSM